MRELSSHRQWPVPNRRPFLRMKWHDLLFMHWAVPEAVLRPLIPEALTLDTYDGNAWIGVVPFRMSDVAPVWSPAIPGLSAFPELNVRTYVRYGEKNDVASKPGVYFFSLDATNPIAVRCARWFFHLNYIDASIQCVYENSSSLSIHYRSRRRHGWPDARLDAHYRTTGEVVAPLTELETWLTSRYCMYAASNRGVLYRGEIDHPPWQLERAECLLRTNTMTEWLGITLPAEQPLLHFSRELAVVAWSMDRI